MWSLMRGKVLARGETEPAVCWFFFFFFQAEDGIRDLIVTGVQTCALPISLSHARCRAAGGVSDRETNRASPRPGPPGRGTRAGKPRPCGAPGTAGSCRRAACKPVG